MKLQDIKFWDITKSVVVICAILFVGYHAHGFVNSIKETNRIMQEKIIAISENSTKIEARATSNNAVKELKEKFDRENSEILAAFKQHKKRTNETLDELGQVKAELKRTRQLNVSTDKIYKKGTQDKKHWYFFKKIMIKGEDGEDVPFAWVMFYPWRTSDKQWKTGTYELEIDTKVIESENQDGTFNRYAEVDLIGKDGKELPVKLTEVKWEKVEIGEKRFHWWNPRLGLSTALGKEASMGIGLSLASYGRTSRDMDWRFMNLGIGISGSDGDYDGMLTVEPASWNFGNVIPLIENLFGGPYYGWNTSDETFGLNFSIPF